MFANTFEINPYIWPTVFVSLLMWYFWNKRNASGLPGPRGFPLIGVIPLLGKCPEKVMAKWAKKYGSLFGIQVGWKDVAIIGSPEVAYEAFAKNDCFNDRPQSIALVSDGRGVIMINSTDFHREQRRFGLFTLRDFGMGRHSLESQLLDVSNGFCEKIGGFCTQLNVTSQPFQIDNMVYDTVSSVICRMVFGHDINKNNEGLYTFIEKMVSAKSKKNQGFYNFLKSVLMLAPVFRHLPFFAKIWKEGIDFQKACHKGIEKEILLHQQSHDPNNSRDFIDCFLNEMEKAKETNNSGDVIIESAKTWKHSSMSEDEVEECSSKWKPYSSFYMNQLVAVVRDLFIAGTETTATTILWIILFLSRYPEVQKKMQEEIDNVLGQSGVPKMSLLEKMPYVRAVIQEVTRLRPLTPLNLPHMASRDATLMGYHIPKGAIILTNIWGIHHDESRWPEPERFLPERHLDKDGKFVRSSNWMIFGVGHRSCLGQQLARMELFIVIVSLFQRFRFSSPPGEQPDMDGESGIVLRPNAFNVIAAQR